MLVAPTWGESSLIERDPGRAALDVLLESGAEVILRPHPMTSRRLPRLIDDLRRSHAANPRFRIEQDMSASESWLWSDLMVSDWSGAASEYAFALGRPVIFLDTPPKLMNPDWNDIGLPSFEDQVRSEIGCVIGLDQVDRLAETVHRLVARPRAAPRSIPSRSGAGGSSTWAGAHRSPRASSPPKRAPPDVPRPGGAPARRAPARHVHMGRDHQPGHLPRCRSGRSVPVPGCRCPDRAGSLRPLAAPHQKLDAGHSPGVGIHAVHGSSDPGRSGHADLCGVVAPRPAGPPLHRSTRAELGVATVHRAGDGDLQHRACGRRGLGVRLCRFGGAA